MSMLKPGLLATVAVCASLGPLALFADSGLSSMMEDQPALLMHGSKGYLGVTIADVDPSRATELKLRDIHGAEVTLLDHDAPACKAGMRLHDVIVQMDGQSIQGVDQLRKMLHETPAGRNVTFVVSRDGQPVTLTIQLADRATIAKEAIVNQFSVPEPAQETESYVWVPARSQGESAYGNGVLGSFTPNPLYVGVVLDPVGAQLADYFGVSNGTGLLVKSVDDNGPAGAAGMKAGDVVLKVNDKTMATGNDWLKAIRANKGRQVQVTILRNRKEQTLVMSAGIPKRG